MTDFVRLKGAWDELSPFHILSIVDDRDGLTVSLEEYRRGTPKGRFRFDAHYAYRNFNESDLHGYFDGLGGHFTTGLYLAEDSEWMRWAAAQSVYQELPKGVLHYMVASVEDVLEVLSFEPPLFESA